MGLKLAFKAILLSLVIGCCLAVEKKPKLVSTLLNAKWARTPFVLEASEFLANEHNDYFWALIDYLSEPDNLDLATKVTEEELYQRLIEFSSR